MFELVFLGTSASAPSIYRGLTSTAVLAGEHRFLVDCGEGTQRQILRSGIGFKRLNHILLTHAHLDHILGLGGLISTFVRWENMDELTIWGGKSALERVEALIYEVVLRNETPPIPIHLNQVQPGVIFESDAFTIQAFPVTHRGKGCFGYIFEERTHHPFLAEKAEKLGVPVGPERGKLVHGESIMLDNGEVITPDMVLGEPRPGVKIVFTGDVGRTDNLRPHVDYADALITEATFLDEEHDMARQFGHITAKQAGELADASNVKHLFLHHVSRRYRERDIVNEARAAFSDTIVVRDLDHFVIRRDKPVEKVETDLNHGRANNSESD